MQLRHIGIVCRDLKQTLDFYVKWFGCTVSRSMDESGSFVSTILNLQRAQLKTIKLDFPDGQTQLELLCFDNPPIELSTVSLVSEGITHFAIKVENLMNLYLNMSEEDVVFLSEPKTSDDGKASVCFCKDPGGVYIELVEII